MFTSSAVVIVKKPEKNPCVLSSTLILCLDSFRIEFLPAQKKGENLLKWGFNDHNDCAAVWL